MDDEILQKSPLVFWSRVVVLGTVAAVFPLIEPRTHIPIDPLKNPISTPSQTSSILSQTFYVYLLPLIIKAARQTITFLDFPPLPDTLAATYVAQANMQFLDPLEGQRKSGLTWALFWINRWEITKMIGLLLGRVISGFASPFALNRLLT